MTYRRGLSALLALGFLVAACDAAISPTPAENTAPHAPTSGVPAQTYTARDHDLCTKTDLSVLQPTLGLTVRTTRRDKPHNGAGEACVFELNTPSGHPATLRVEAAAAASEAEAEQIYKAQVTGRMAVEGAVAGIGERAEAFALETEPGFKYGEYKIHARDDNLVLEVWLAVGGNTFPPKTHTGGIVRAVSDSTYRGPLFCVAHQNGLSRTLMDTAPPGSNRGTKDALKQATKLAGGETVVQSHKAVPTRGVST